MTSEIPAAQRVADRTFRVPPGQETSIPGTAFVVRRDGIGDAMVSVLPDGAIDLGQAKWWIVRTA